MEEKRCGLGVQPSVRLWRAGRRCHGQPGAWLEDCAWAFSLCGRISAGDTVSAASRMYRKSCEQNYCDLDQMYFLTYLFSLFDNQMQVNVEWKNGGSVTESLCSTWLHFACVKCSSLFPHRYWESLFFPQAPVLLILMSATISPLLLSAGHSILWQQPQLDWAWVPGRKCVCVFKQKPCVFIFLCLCVLVKSPIDKSAISHIIPSREMAVLLSEAVGENSN